MVADRDEELADDVSYNAAGAIEDLDLEDYH
jgi:hypothetical protein